MVTIPKKIKVKWHNGMEDTVLNETYDPSGLCDICDNKGAFFVNETPIVGLCFTHILKQYGKDNVEVI